MSELIRYVGNPFLDVGVAAITACVGRRNPHDVDMQDLIQVADYLKDAYTNIEGVVRQSTSLFMNGFGNSSFIPSKKKEETPEKLLSKREAAIKYADDTLYGFLPEAPKLDVPCIFYPEKSAYIYAHRQFMPLLAAERTVNFSPEGRQNGLPISGEALLAISAILLGAFRSQNWLIFHEISPSSDVDMTLLLARKAYEGVHQTISLLRLAPESKWPTMGKPRQVYINKILETQSLLNQRDVKFGNITGYYFSNFGTSPSIEVIRLENDVWNFISTAKNDAERAWNRFLEVGKGDKDYNRSYDVLFDLPHNYSRFISLLKQVADWNFTEIFLRKVMKMNQRRIDRLKEIGEKLVNYMDKYERDGQGKIKRSLYHKFSRTNDFNEFRRVLVDASDNAFKKGPEPLITMDDFILAFDPENRYEGWKLARDLVTLKMIELLVTRDLELEESDNEESTTSSERDSELDESNVE